MIRTDSHNLLLEYSCKNQTILAFELDNRVVLIKNSHIKLPNTEIIQYDTTDEFIQHFSWTPEMISAIIDYKFKDSVIKEWYVVRDSNETL